MEVAAQRRRKTGSASSRARMGQDENACMSLGLGLAGPTGDGDHGAFVSISSRGTPVAENGGNETPQVGDVIIAFRNMRVSPGFVSTKVRPRSSRTYRGWIKSHAACFRKNAKEHGALFL